jgi:hypothetical protein
MVNNKGVSQSFTFIVVLVLFLLVLGLYIGWNVNLGAEYINIGEESKCEASVLAASHSIKIWRGDPIDCPTKYVQFDSESSLKVKKRLADGLASCWSKFGEGKLLLFDQSPTFFGNDTTEFCNVCEVYEFEDIDNLDDFGEYLANEGAPKRYIEDKTYFEYLQGADVSEENLREFSNKVLDNSVDTSKDYASIFVYTKDPSLLNLKYRVDNAFRSGPVGYAYYGLTALLFGKDVGADWKSFVVLVPYEKQEISQLCKNLEA